VVVSGLLLLALSLLNLGSLFPVVSRFRKTLLFCSGVLAVHLGGNCLLPLGSFGVADVLGFLLFPPFLPFLQVPGLPGQSLLLILFFVGLPLFGLQFG
jgi:hypothetical protein